MPAIETHFIENQNTVQFSGGTQTRLTFAQSNLTVGQSYLLIYRGHFGPNLGRGRYRVRQDGVEIGQLRPTRSSPSTSGRMYEMAGFTRIIAGATGDIILEAQAMNDQAGQRWGSEQMLIIGLNDLVLDTDWFEDENSGDDPGGTTFGSELQPARIAFTPDGVSDYLILGYVSTLFNATDAFAARITNGAVEATKWGPGGGNIGDEQPIGIMGHVLSAPPAVSTAIQTGYQSGEPKKDKIDTGLFILRLNKFEDHAIVENDLNNAAPTGARESLAGPVNITPGASGEVIAMFFSRAEMAPGFGGTPGARNELEFNATVVAQTQAGSLATFSGQQAGNAKTDNWGGESLVTKITGAAQTPTAVQGFGTGASALAADQSWRTQTLVAFTTDFVVAPLTPPDQPETPTAAASLSDAPNYADKAVLRLASQFRSGA